MPNASTAAAPDNEFTLDNEHVGKDVITWHIGVAVRGIVRAFLAAGTDEDEDPAVWGIQHDDGKKEDLYKNELLAALLASEVSRPCPSCFDAMFAVDFAWVFFLSFPRLIVPFVWRCIKSYSSFANKLVHKLKTIHDVFMTLLISFLPKDIDRTDAVFSEGASE